MRRSDDIRNADGNPTDETDTLLGMAIGRRISVLLRSRNLTPRDLENHLGKSKGSAASIISGRRGSRMSASYLQQIADALDVDVGWLLNGRPQSRKTPLVGLKEHGVPPLSSSVWPRHLKPLASPMTSGSVRLAKERATKKRAALSR